MTELDEPVRRPASVPTNADEPPPDPMHRHHDRQRAAYTEHALWQLAAERVESVLASSPHLSGDQLLERLREASALALEEHHRLRAMVPRG